MWTNRVPPQHEAAASCGTGFQGEPVCSQTCLRLLHLCQNLKSENLRVLHLTFSRACDVKQCVLGQGGGLRPNKPFNAHNKEWVDSEYKMSI
ncbi:jg20488 [Pararge aegeria aegeria]|uniref:Jg20488 protein n=1 Tax=Pararge aegeria aegeria TaxID=348720 RepID=A0A8S4RWJ5_9NEOP|nr:jg20488 [Pararge aegeria aegeria]